MADLILDFMSRSAPVIAGMIWILVVIRRTQVDCMRICERVHEEMRRLSREKGLDDPPPTPDPTPEPIEPKAPLPVARLLKK